MEVILLIIQISEYEPDCIKVRPSVYGESIIITPKKIGYPNKENGRERIFLYKIIFYSLDNRKDLSKIYSIQWIGFSIFKIY
jgi:hypothetical protein